MSSPRPQKPQGDSDERRVGSREHRLFLGRLGARRQSDKDRRVRGRRAQQATRAAAETLEGEGKSVHWIWKTGRNPNRDPKEHRGAPGLLWRRGQGAAELPYGGLRARAPPCGGVTPTSATL